MSHYEMQKVLNEMVAEHEKEVLKMEQRLVDFALEHNLYLSLGEYGNGRTLLLEDDPWNDAKRGDWLYSSETC